MKKSLSCKLGFHLPMYWSKGDVCYHYYRLLDYDKRKCSYCNVDLGVSKKQLKQREDIATEVARIRDEIKEHGHPLITGITV